MGDSKIDPHCRIAKVHRKGGASVSIIEPDLSPSSITKGFDRHVQKMAESFRTDMAGYAIVVWDRAGRSSTECACGNSSPYGRRLLPDFTKESVRAFLVQRTVEDILKDK